MKRKRARGPGRPELPPEERRNVLLPIRLTEAEKADIDAAADGNASAWARKHLNRLAKDAKKRKK